MTTYKVLRDVTKVGPSEYEDLGTVDANNSDHAIRIKALDAKLEPNVQHLYIAIPLSNWNVAMVRNVQTTHLEVLPAI